MKKLSIQKFRQDIKENIKILNKKSGCLILKIPENTWSLKVQAKNKHKNL